MPKISTPKNRLACLVLIFSGPALPQQATYIEIIKPIQLVQLLAYDQSVIPSSGIVFRTVEEAWAIYKKSIDVWNAPTISMGRYGTASNLRGCGEIYGFSWGRPMHYCHDYVTHYENGDLFSGTTHVITLFDVCPKGYNYDSQTPLSGTGNTGSPYIFERTCSIRKLKNQPKTCGPDHTGGLAFGDPIYPLQGENFHQALDYSSSKRLSISRYYTNTMGRFVFNFENTFIPPIKGTTKNSCRNLDIIYNTDNYTACFYEINTDDQNSVYIDKNGDRQEFQKIGGNYISINEPGSLLKQNGSDWLIKNRGAGEWTAVNDKNQVIYTQNIDGQKIYRKYSAIGTSEFTFTTAIYDDFGRQIIIEYEDSGIIKSAVDPAGKRIEYSPITSPAIRSSSDGGTIRPQYPRIKSVQYQDLSKINYFWDEASLLSGNNYIGKLTGIEDENKIRHETFSYKDDKATATQMAGGVGKYLFDYVNPYTIRITDPFSQSHDLAIAPVRGMNGLFSQSQPAGSGCAASSNKISYDSSGNIMSRDDFNGYRSCFAYDDLRQQTSKVEGLSSGAVCSDVLVTGAALPSGSRKVTTQWHPEWKLKTRQAEPNRITTWVYNGQVDPFNGGAVASCAPASAVLPDGKPIAVLCRQVEQETTDASGSLGFAAVGPPRAAVREQKWTYNAFGQILTHDGPRTDVADITTYTYYSDTTADHTLGDLKSVTNAAGKVVNYTQYNKHGQVLSMADANGVVTAYTYDLRQRLKSVAVGGQLTQYDYDLAGQLKKVTQPDASTLGYDHDDAHRLTAVYDNLGNRIDYVLDNAGNRKEEKVTGAGGVLKRKLTRVIDALGRVQQTTSGE